MEQKSLTLKPIESADSDEQPAMLNVIGEDYDGTQLIVTGELVPKIWPLPRPLNVGLSVLVEGKKYSETSRSISDLLGRDVGERRPIRFSMVTAAPSGAEYQLELRWGGELQKEIPSIEVGHSGVSQEVRCKSSGTECSQEWVLKASLRNPAAVERTNIVLEIEPVSGLLDSKSVAGHDRRLVPLGGFKLAPGQAQDIRVILPRWMGGEAAVKIVNAE